MKYPFIKLKQTIIRQVVINAFAVTVDNEIRTESEIAINDLEVSTITRGKKSEL